MASLPPVADTTAPIGRALRAGQKKRALALKQMVWDAARRAPRFWVLQTLGWLSYFLFYTTVTMRVGDGPNDDITRILTNSALAAGLGFVLTSILRLPFRALRRLPIGEAMAFAAPLVIATSVVFAAVELPLQKWRLPSDWSYLLYVVPTKLYLIGAWSALYFSISYYLEWKRQSERALKADAAAQQAQLRMLRYQLNPHFLFNALNAVSALILEGDNDRADRLVSKLSAFLRQSLVSQPGEMVTVDQEFAANLNYLDIEMVRFGERLNVDVHIDEGAHHARVPSLMLQPLVENAVKYAIAPSEDGGTISLQALARRGRLILRVDDDGPGLPTEVRRSGHDPASCGVGLANTAERLIHIYGEEHQFEVGDRPGGGTRVEIAIPLTTDSSEVNP